MSRAFIPGLELAEHYYTEIVGPIVDEALDGAPYAAALIGYGSEVQGYDTLRSTDHAWGPRVQILLDDDGRDGRDDSGRAARVEAALERSLPREFRGHPVRFAFPAGAPDRHWVEVLDTRAFFTAKLNAGPDGGLTAAQWLLVPTQTLRELTAGAVFRDDTGLLTRYRAELAWYPDDVWRYVLACQWQRVSQEEAFVGRCGEVGDDLGSALVTARLVRDLMRLCMLMSRVYPAYSKWLGTAFAALPSAEKLGPVLSGALRAQTWRAREDYLAVAYELVASQHNALDLTEPLDGSARPYHGRPFRVLHAERFTEALLATVADPAIRTLPPVGAVDQYVDSTDLTDHNHAARRRRYLTGPPLPTGSSGNAARG